MKFASVHCVRPEIAMPHLKAIDDLLPDVIGFLGDTTYGGYDDTRWGLTTRSTDQPVGQSRAIGSNAIEESRYAAHHARFLANPGVDYLVRKYNTRWVIDNHEISTAWDHTPGNCNRYENGTLMSQFHVNETYQNARRAYDKAHAHQSHLYASGTGDIPPEALTGSPANAIASLYPPRWFSEVVGNCEFFYLDCLGGHHPAFDLAFNAPTKKLIGDNQRAWLDAALQASTAEFLIIVSSKAAYAGATAGGGQGWDNYVVQLEDIIDTYTTAGVRGVCWVGGNAHHPRSLSGSGLWGFDFAGITAGPGAQDNPISDSLAGTPTDPDRPNVTFLKRKDDAIEPWHFSYIETGPGTLTAKVIDQFGTELFSGSMIPTSNAWQ